MDPDDDVDVDVDVMTEDFAGAGYRPEAGDAVMGWLERLRRPATEQRPVWRERNHRQRMHRSTTSWRTTDPSIVRLGCAPPIWWESPAQPPPYPLLLARPRVGAAVFAVSWSIQVAGHRIFERNSPALTKGFVTYQLCGLAFWCEEMGDLVVCRRAGPADVGSGRGAGGSRGSWTTTGTTSSTPRR